MTDKTDAEFIAACEAKYRKAEKWMDGGYEDDAALWSDFEQALERLKRADEFLASILGDSEARWEFPLKEQEAQSGPKKP